jgi:hypothetical protein
MNVMPAVNAAGESTFEQEITMAQRSKPGPPSVPLNEDLRQRLTTRAEEINKSVNDCVTEAVEQWLEVTEDDPRAGAPAVAPEATAPV